MKHDVTKKRRLLLGLLLGIVCLAGVGHAADWGRIPSDTIRQVPSAPPPSLSGHTRQVPPPVSVGFGFSISSSPQQFPLDYVFDGSGRGWWSGNNLVNLTISRNDPAQALRFRSFILFSNGRQFTLNLPTPGLYSFSSTFERVPVFEEQVVRMACSNFLSNRGPATYQAVITIKGLAVSNTGAENWYTITDGFPIIANLRCLRVIEVAK